MLLVYLSHSFYNKFIKSVSEVVNENIFLANENIFLKRRLYMMADNQYRFLAIYVIPLTVNLGVIIHNSSVTNKTNVPDEAPSLQEMINLKKKGVFGNKYTNFKRNFITDF
jgi:hypothetical protein